MIIGFFLSASFVSANWWCGGKEYGDCSSIDPTYKNCCVLNSIAVCLYDYQDCSQFCCIGGGCDSWDDFWFCPEGSIANCVNFDIHCCPSDYPKWVPNRGGKCWKEDWECVYDEDCHESWVCVNHKCVECREGEIRNEVCNPPTKTWQECIDGVWHNMEKTCYGLGPGCYQICNPETKEIIASPCTPEGWTTDLSQCQKTCEDYGYHSSLTCPEGYEPKKIEVNGLTCYTECEQVKCFSNDDCMWCGQECVLRKPDLVCPKIAPPEGFKCICVDGQCTAIKKTCEDYGYKSSLECPKGWKAETIEVNGLTCYTRCIQVVFWKIEESEKIKKCVESEDGEYPTKAECLTALKSICKDGWKYNETSEQCEKVEEKVELPLIFGIGAIGVLILLILRRKIWK